MEVPAASPRAIVGYRIPESQWVERQAYNDGQQMNANRVR